MKSLKSILPISLLALAGLPLTGFSQDSPMARATAAIQAATARAQSDPAHPVFHITAPAQWINDPNGPIYHKGYYHLFYQLHPFSDESGPKYWGHVRSRNLVTWEHLPIALCPSEELGEAEIWSGCCTENGHAQPMIFYTSIARGKPAGTHAEQWAALSDDNMLVWRKLPSNPALTEALHGERKVYDWRDPFIFHDEGKTFLVTGGNLNEARGGQAVVNIYQALNPELTKWTYRGVMFQHPDANARTIECPNFFKLGKQCVLVVSPYGKVEYFVGEFDSATCHFHSRGRGVLDYGPGFYAPNTMQLAGGRRLVWGWVNGFPSGHGWNGCLSLPRELTWSAEEKLRQEPARELRKLRGERREWRSSSLTTQDTVLALPESNALEIQAAFDLQPDTVLSVHFKSNADAAPITLQCSQSRLMLNDITVPFNSTEKELRLHVFFDRSVLEVFANEISCFTKTIRPLESKPVMLVSAQNGTATFKQGEAWTMKTIWQR